MSAHTNRRPAASGSSIFLRMPGEGAPERGCGESRAIGQYRERHHNNTNTLKEEPETVSETKQQAEQAEKMPKWKTALIVITVIAFILWAGSGESGDGSDCTRLGNGTEWGADC